MSNIQTVSYRITRLMIVDYRDRLRQSLPSQTLRTHILMTIPTYSYDQFNPRQYLDEYYANFPPENLALLQFLIDSFAAVPPDALALDFGSGPTLFSPIAGAHRVREMHLCEYLPANRAELERWLCAEPDAFDWQPTIRTALAMGGFDDTLTTLELHGKTVRERVKQVMPCNLLHDFPLENTDLRGTYDVLVSNLCAEAVAPDIQTWNRHIAKFADLLKPGGLLIMTTVKQSRAYSVGEHNFSVLPLTERDVIAGLRAAGFRPDSIVIDQTSATHSIHPYDGLIFATARKPS